MRLVKKVVTAFFEKAGITVGEMPNADIIVRDRRFWRHTLRHGSLGLGESYAWKWCDISDIDIVIKKIIKSEQDRSWLVLLADLPLWLKSQLVDLQSEKRRSKIASEHYDLPFEFYRPMLGPTLAYTSGILLPGEGQKFSMFALTTTQLRKFKRVFNEVRLEPGQSVLDIGCGYGELCRYLLSRDVYPHGISNSVGHISIAKDLSRNEKQPGIFSVMDYKDVQGTYDAIVSIEMIESVGPKHLREFFAICGRLLKPGGRMLIQAIVTDRYDYAGNAFLEKYIFPGAVINNENLLLAAASEFFKHDDSYDMTESYPHTLECWSRNMSKAYIEGAYTHINLAGGGKIDETFIRKFHFYFMLSKGAFMARRNRVVQYTFVKK